MLCKRTEYTYLGRVGINPSYRFRKPFVQKRISHLGKLDFYFITNEKVVTEYRNFPLVP